jgi:hypothetical protein
VANIEKHPKPPAEQAGQADFSEVPTCARNGSPRDVPRAEEETRAVIMRIEGLPPTPHNLTRMQERVKRLNRLLADSGVPFRLRVLRVSRAINT